MTEQQPVIYWDASAILSALFSDSHSQTAKKWVDRGGIHFMSSLSFAEVCAVISRMRREGFITDVLLQSATEVLNNGPWRRLQILPDWLTTRALSLKWSLRGADLWHLATAKGLQNDFPELVLLSFDSRLAQSAQGESLQGSMQSGA
jgi:predicted nucleic acid-binding protein